MAESHGHSVAAWTGVIVMLVGTALIGLGLIFDQSIMWIIGIVAVVAGAAAWVVLNKAGYGEHGRNTDTSTAARR